MRRFQNSVCALLFVAVSCSPKIYPESNSECRTDTLVQERLVHDTTYFEVPYERVVNVTKDTVSVLETAFALSSAEITGGLLHHTLENKRQTVSVPYVKPVTVTTISTNEIRVVYREVEKRLSLWQSFSMVLGWILGGGLLLYFALWLIVKIKK